jgi:DNA-directed RNA polymerase subunit RPC12/RpoP
VIENPTEESKSEEVRYARAWRALRLLNWANYVVSVPFLTWGCLFLFGWLGESPYRSEFFKYLLTVAIVLVYLRQTFKCPRCGKNFADRHVVGFIKLAQGRCTYCGLKKWSPSDPIRNTSTERSSQSRNGFSTHPSGISPRA